MFEDRVRSKVAGKTCMKMHKQFFENGRIDTHLEKLTQWLMPYLYYIFSLGEHSSKMTLNLDFRFCQKHSCRGRILGSNWDKTITSFPSSYSLSPSLYMETSSLRTLKIMPRDTSTKLDVHEFGFITHALYVTEVV
jgi:hypothetical protein